MDNNSINELVKMARENRQFTIIKRKRAIIETERRRNRQAIIAGMCFLSGIVIAKSNGIDIGIDSLPKNMALLNSWKDLKKLFQDMGPGVTTMSFLSAISIVNTVKSQRKLKSLRNERNDFNASIEYFENSWEESQEREEYHHVRTR